MQSTDVVEIYDEKYFLEAVDGFREFSEFDGKFSSLFERYQRNIELLELNNNHKLLEVGCGRGEICIHHALNGGNADGIDFSKDAISLAVKKAQQLNVKNVTFQESPFQNIQKPDSSYDRILASEFIEHVSKEEGELFMKMAYSLLKPNGKILIFTHPNTLQRKYGYPIKRYINLLRGKKLPIVQDDMLHDHYKLFHLNEQNHIELRNLAKSAGFNKIKVGYDVAPNKKGLKKALIRIINTTPLKHILFTNLYMLAEK